MNHRQWSQAYDAGRSARRAGSGRDSCPRYGIIPEAREMADRWRQGWDDEDAERKGRAG